MQPHFGGDGISHSLNEPLGILDLPRHVVFDNDVLLIAGEKFRRPRIVDTEAAVEEDRCLEKPLGVQAGFCDGADGTAELRNQDELGLAHRKERGPYEDNRDYGERGGIVFLVRFHFYSSSRNRGGCCGASRGAEAGPISTPSSSMNKWRRP